MKRILPISTVLVIAFLIPTRAFADITAFLGVTPTPNSRPARGFAVGMGLLIVGFEFEYSNTSDDVLDGAPRLKTYMGNALLQTPIPIAGSRTSAPRQTLASTSAAASSGRSRGRCDYGWTTGCLRCRDRRDMTSRSASTRD
jgi:hypothetical protein